MPTDKLKVIPARRHRWIGVIGFCLVLLFPVLVLADFVSGKVIKVVDSDTIYVLDDTLNAT